LLRLADWANVCCGAHAGDLALTRRTLERCAAHAHLRVGAHPGYPDPEHFGRRPLFRNPYTPAQITDMIATQVHSAGRITAELGVTIHHVKPHGALYNEAARDGEVAQAIALGVLATAKDAHLVGLAGSVMLRVFRRAGFVALAEGFLDRRYTPDGQLVPRTAPDALIGDPAEALQQWRSLAAKCQTVCVHSDSPNALPLLRALKPALNR
jgi:UPF0271 protein